MSPEDALKAMEMLRAKRMVPIHWGAFRLSLEPVEEPPRHFLRLLQERKINPKAVLLQPGERILI
jgi:L-ascorbate metabolism protein UlaG (beta-lactamase superfamily)